MRILCTNDDGIHAPGLKALEHIARSLSDDVWVVAPEVNHSGAGHSLTLKRPLRVREWSPRRFSVDGTPTDCVLLALQNVIKDKKVDLVLSGVNHGGNLGDDVTYSGTVAAAMEATLFDIPAIALSQCMTNSHPVKWATAEKQGTLIVRRLIDHGWAKGVLINVNFPDRVAHSVKGARVCRQGKHKIGDNLVERIDPRGEAYVWVGGLKTEDLADDGSDRAMVRKGLISVTPIHLDMTHYDELSRLSNILTD